MAQDVGATCACAMVWCVLGSQQEASKDKQRSEAPPNSSRPLWRRNEVQSELMLTLRFAELVRCIFDDVKIGTPRNVLNFAREISAFATYELLQKDYHLLLCD